VDGDGTARDLTIDTNGTTGTILFDGLVGANNDLDVIDITGNLDLDAAISEHHLTYLSPAPPTSVPM
jgi:hypothetical protein